MMNTRGDIQIGLYLMRNGVTLSGSRLGPYRGVDRMPQTPSPFALASASPSGRPGWDRLWLDYWAAEDAGSLHADLLVARSFQEQFGAHGIDLELVYITLAALPDDRWLTDEIWKSNLAEAVARYQTGSHIRAEAPVGAQHLGFDIAWPVPSFHSAIYEPGLDKVSPNFVGELNAHGLFGDIDQAVAKLDEALSLRYSPTPFCVLGVYHVPKGLK